MFTINVKENEKVLLYKDEKFVKVLDVGVHKHFHWFENYTIERMSDSFGPSQKRSEKMLKQFPENVTTYFHIIALNEDEKAYVWVDGNFVELLPAGATQLYFKELNLKVEKVNIKESVKVDDMFVKYIDRLPKVADLSRFFVDKFTTGYLYINEKFVDTLPTGKHYYYNNFYDIDVKYIDNRIKELEVTGQELLTHDKVTLRCNATLHYQIVDGLKYLTEIEYAPEYLYKQLQFAIREHIGRLEVDSVITQQHTLSEDIVQKLMTLFEVIGVKITSIHIKDIILPGDMREIFNQVITAAKRAEATNIQRREETAATRSLLNTAKLMKDNPALARLKELEALEKITQTVGTLNVYGGLDHVMNNMVKLSD